MSGAELVPPFCRCSFLLLRSVFALDFIAFQDTLCGGDVCESRLCERLVNNYPSPKMLTLTSSTALDDCRQPFKRYRKFAKEVDLFQKNLKIQHTIFRRQCRILLENVTQESTAVQKALSESNHPLWSDSEVEQQLEQYLAESKDACVTAIELIKERLEKVQGESADLGLVIAHDHEVGAGLWDRSKQRWQLT